MEEQRTRAPPAAGEDTAPATVNKRATMCVFGCLFALGCRSNVIRKLAFYPPLPGYSFGPQGEFYLFDASSNAQTASPSQQQQQKRESESGKLQEEALQQQQQPEQQNGQSWRSPRVTTSSQQPELLTTTTAAASVAVAGAAAGAAASSPECSACVCRSCAEQQQQRSGGGSAGEQQQQRYEKESVQSLLLRAGLPEQLETLKIKPLKRRSLRSRREDYIAALFLYLPLPPAGKEEEEEKRMRSSFSRRKRPSPSPLMRRRRHSPAAPEALAAGGSSAASTSAAADDAGAAEIAAAAAQPKEESADSGDRALLPLSQSTPRQRQQPTRTLSSGNEVAAAAADPETHQRMLESASRRMCIIFSHGNSTDIGYMFALYYRLVYKCRVNVLAYDYRGYGRSAGKTSEQSLYRDIRLVWQYATKVLHVPPTNIILYGHSLGSAPSCDLAMREESFPVGGVILHSAISSGLRLFIDDLEKSPWFDAFPNVDKLRKVYHTPVLIIHGKLDRQVFWVHSHRLELAAREADETVRRAKEQQQLTNGRKKDNQSPRKATAPTANGGRDVTRGRSAGGLEDLRPMRVQTWWVASADHNDVEQKTGDLYYQRIDEFVHFCQAWAAARQLNSN